MIQIGLALLMGTLLIGTEEMTYTGKTSTTFTGITRNTNSAGAASAVDDATVKLASFSEDIFSGFTDQLRNTFAAAAVTSSAPAAGGTLNHVSFVRGPYDIIVDMELPDADTMQGAMAVVYASGAFSNCIYLECVDHLPIVAAAQKIVGSYTPPNA